AATQRLQQISTQLIQEDDIEILHNQILDAAVAIMGSDMASMQIVDQHRNGLRMLAWRGFDTPFGELFGFNRPDARTSCSAARRTGRRVIVPDIVKCDFMI